MKFEIYKSAGEWRWRLRAANGEIIATGEGYVNRSGAEGCIHLVASTSESTPIVDVDK